MWEGATKGRGLAKALEAVKEWGMSGEWREAREEVREVREAEEKIIRGLTGSERASPGSRVLTTRFTASPYPTMRLGLD